MWEICESWGSRHRSCLSLLRNPVFCQHTRDDASQRRTFAWPLYLKYMYVFVQCNLIFCFVIVICYAFSRIDLHTHTHTYIMTITFRAPLTFFQSRRIWLRDMPLQFRSSAERKVAPLWQVNGHEVTHTNKNCTPSPL